MSNNRKLISISVFLLNLGIVWAILYLVLSLLGMETFQVLFVSGSLAIALVTVVWIILGPKRSSINNPGFWGKKLVEEASNLPINSRMVGQPEIYRGNLKKTIRIKRPSVPPRSDATAQPMRPPRKTAPLSSEPLKADRKKGTQARSQSASKLQTASTPPPETPKEKTAIRIPYDSNIHIDPNADENEIRKALLKRKKQFLWLAAEAKSHLQTVDDYLQKHMSQNTTGSVHAVILTQRVIDAIEDRVERIDEFLGQTSVADHSYADFLLNGELESKKDALSSLINNSDLPPLKPAELKTELLALLKRISRRRSIFDGVEFQFPDDI